MVLTFTCKALTAALVRRNNNSTAPARQDVSFSKEVLFSLIAVIPNRRSSGSKVVAIAITIFAAMRPRTKRHQRAGLFCLKKDVICFIESPNQAVVHFPHNTNSH